MDLIEELRGLIVVLAPRGRLDSASSPALGARLDQLASAPDARLILDLGAVDFVSSAGLRVILSAAKKARAARGRLVICAVQPSVQEVLDISGFTVLLAIHPARERAFEALAA